MFCKCSQKYGHGPKSFGASIEIFGPAYNTMLHQKSSDTRTHTHTLRVQTQLSHSEKSPKQTKTETSQLGSHRQKSPWPEVIRFYSNEKTLHETVQSWLTLVNFKYMLVCICIFKNSGLVFSSTLYGQLGPNFQRWTKISCKCSEKYCHGPKNFGASIEIFEPVYNTMLHQKSSDTHTHTHTHTLRVQTQLSHSDKPPKQTKTETTNKDLVVRSLPGQK